MKKIRLGSSALMVSPIGLGTMTFGEQNSESEAHQQLDFALERGINFIDTAEMYPVMPKAETVHRTEAYIGSWIKQSGKRDQIILATKVAGPSRGMPWIRNGENDLNANNIRAALDASLQRLNTDCIDLYQLHWPSRNVANFGQRIFNPELERESVAISETVAALEACRRAGKIRAYGVSNESSWGVAEFNKQAQALGAAPIASIQNPYHLMNRSYEADLIETCYREQVGLLAYSPLAFGRLTGKYLKPETAQGRLTHFPPTWSPRYMRPEVIQASQAYAQLAQAHGLTPTQMALAWCYQQWFVASTIIGATNLKQLAENIDAYQVKLSDELIAQINQLHVAMNNPAQ